MNRPKSLARPWIPKSTPVGIANRARDPFYHTNRWKTESKQFLEDNPLCVECEKKGLLVPAKLTDHIVPKPICKDPWDRTNWRPLCVACHPRKSAMDKKYFK